MRGAEGDRVVSLGVLLTGEDLLANIVQYISRSVSSGPRYSTGDPRPSRHRLASQLRPEAQSKSRLNVVLPLLPSILMSEPIP